MSNEIFRPVTVLEVSNLGRLRYRGRGRECPIDKDGYRSLTLRETLHRLVAFTFIGPPPSPNHVVDHINRDELDNRVDNLRWVTKRDNLINSATGDKMTFRPPPPTLDDIAARRRAVAAKRAEHIKRQKEAREARRLRPYLVADYTQGRTHLLVRANKTRVKLASCRDPVLAASLLEAAEAVRGGAAPETFLGERRAYRVACRMAALCV